MEYYVKSAMDVGKHGDGKYIISDNGKRTGKVKKVLTYTCDEKKVDESQKSLTDVSTLLEPAIRKGLLRHSAEFSGEYDDIPPLTYQDALNTIAKAEEMFAELPHKVRQRFPTANAFLEFVHDPSNANEMENLGILRGNDGRIKGGELSGAPSPGDLNADGIKDVTEGTTNEPID
jgi:phage internal scaffolding protein